MRTIYKAAMWLLTDSPWPIRYCIATIISTILLVGILYVTHFLSK